MITVKLLPTIYDGTVPRITQIPSQESKADL